MPHLFLGGGGGGGGGAKKIVKIGDLVTQDACTSCHVNFTLHSVANPLSLGEKNIDYFY